jgi:hypothetical protein
VLSIEAFFEKKTQLSFNQCGSDLFQFLIQFYGADGGHLPGFRLRFCDGVSNENHVFTEQALLFGMIFWFPPLK